ncbi:hypothetical protein CEE45_16520 [Candidatus Heimdallarchaeota archaeon B3_Heim]|nr:MAG: hypothetical protein CEE45_16520 [Candidatus Heimdallarchaeota archaeon B3_Heim]
MTNNVNHQPTKNEIGVKLMIPIIPYIPPSQKGQKPNLIAFIVSSFLLLFLTLALVAFPLLNGMSFNMVFVVLGIIIFIASFIPMFVFLESKQTSSDTGKQVRYVSRPSQSLQPTWENQPQNKYEYCLNCGSLVDRSDFFCATCGSRLK